MQRYTDRHGKSVTRRPKTTDGSWKESEVVHVVMGMVFIIAGKAGS